MGKVLSGTHRRGRAGRQAASQLRVIQITLQGSRPEKNQLNVVDATGTWPCGKRDCNGVRSVHPSLVGHRCDVVEGTPRLCGFCPFLSMFGASPSNVGGVCWEEEERWTVRGARSDMTCGGGFGVSLPAPLVELANKTPGRPDRCAW